MKALFPLIALLLFCHQAAFAQMPGTQSDATKSVQASAILGLEKESSGVFSLDATQL